MSELTSAERWAVSRVRHGTPTGHAKHINLNETPCDACAAAKSRYDARRATSSSRQVRARMRAAAQQEASTILRRRHEDEWRSIYIETCAKRGLTVGTPKRPRVKTNPTTR